MTITTFNAKNPIAVDRLHDEIRAGIYYDCTTTAEMEEVDSELLRYFNEFKGVAIDYNYADYGNLLIAYYEVRDELNDCGFVGVYELTDNEVWNFYKWHVGAVIRDIIETL